MANPYDRAPYVGYSYPQTHPRRLATIARLLGLAPPALETCRVLELGCAAGGNLLPMAERLPGGQFVGIDYSARHIEEARAAAAPLALSNLRFEHRDLLDTPPDFGQFDYIIAHGVYSWVPGPVRERLLSICKHSLAPGGVAYVSYNTLPGWSVRLVTRNLMLLGVRHIDDPAEKARRVRALAQQMTSILPAEKDPYGHFLRQDLEKIGATHDSLILHDLLEESNDPIYFEEFVARAKAAGLAYLGEADFGGMSYRNLPPPVQAVADTVTRDVIELEQFGDFLRQRAFRQTLLVHPEQRADWDGMSARVREMHIASAVQPDGPVGDVRSNAPLTFKERNGTVTTREPLVKAAFLHLGKASPAYVPFGEIVAASSAMVEGGAVAVDPVGGAAARRLGEILLRALASRGADFCLQPEPIASTPPARPRVTRLARLQAQQGNIITNLKHDAVQLTDLGRHILRLLDGEHDMDAITKDLTALAASGRLSIRRDDGAARVSNEPATIAPLATAALQHIASLALLMG